MKKTGHLPRRRTAFTLIELIVVIAIIGLLAAMIIPIAGAVTRQKQIKTAQTQLAALQLAIDSYKTKLGYYPPDNTNNPAINQLYFELLGTTNNGAGTAKPPDTWVTLDGSAQIGLTTTPNISGTFGVSAIANSSTRTHSDDSGAAATSFLNNLTPNQIGVIDANGQIKVLVCSVTWPNNFAPVLPAPALPTLNPWRYMSTHPTNNTGSYDLWVDLVISGKTNRVCNWSTQPIKL
jgi:prepilin-type N-terminal cleavage/methylation domain-containing protein